MKQRIIFFALMLFIAVGVIAGPSVRPTNVPVGALAKKEFIKKTFNKDIKAKKTTTKDGDVVVFEDFSLWTAGSEANPDEEWVEDEEEYLNDGLMQQPGWMGSYCYQAGGSAFIGDDWTELEMGIAGYIMTPIFETPANSYTVKFRARTQGAAGGRIAFFYNWYNETTDEGDYSDEIYVNITQEWEEYSFTCPSAYCADLAYVDFYTDDDYIYIDDIEIALSDEGEEPPTNPEGVVFFEDCGTTAPSSNPRPATAAYTGWRNYGVDNITFSGSNTDVRSTSTMNSHVWFTSSPGSQPCVFEINGINTSNYEDLALSFKLAIGSGSGDVARDYFSVKAVVGSTEHPITLPNTTVASAFSTISGLTGIPSVENVKLVFTSNAAPNGFRLDDITINGTPKQGVSNEIVDAKTQPSFFISGNNLSVRNVTLGSTIEVYNIAGQKLQTAKYFGGGSIHISNLPKGVYIIRVNGGFSTKVVK